MTDFHDLVRAARSIRRFDATRPVSRADLIHLVECARLVPSGGNKQQLRYRLVEDADGVRRLLPALQWAALLRDWAGPAPEERPAAAIVIVAADGRKPGVDCGIAAQTMHLAACARGLGSCMFGAIDVELARRTLHLSDEWAVQMILMLGYPAEEIVIDEIDIWQSKAYYHDREGRHHVPKLALGDVLL